MALTLANINQQPQKFANYVRELLSAQTRLIQSGAMAFRTAQELGLGTFQGAVFDIPFWNEENTAATNLADMNTNVAGDDFTQAAQHVRAIYRGKTWSKADLAQHIAGSDPFGGAAELAARFWAREDQARLLNILTGLFRGGGALNAGFLDSTGAVLDGEIMIEGLGQLGDVKDRIAAIVCHSAVEQHLLTLDEILLVPASDGKSMTKTYKGYELIVDDSMPYDDAGHVLMGAADEAVIFYLGRNSIIFNDEVYNYIRNYSVEATGTEHLAYRRGCIIHPNGVSYTGAPAGLSPTNGELETAADWTLAFNDIRNVPIRAQLVDLA